MLLTLRRRIFHSTIPRGTQSFSTDTYIIPRTAPVLSFFLQMRPRYPLSKKDYLRRCSASLYGGRQTMVVSRTVTTGDVTRSPHDLASTRSHPRLVIGPAPHIWRRGRRRYYHLHGAYVRWLTRDPRMFGTVFVRHIIISCVFPYPLSNCFHLCPFLLL
jgi:hypothetical protein